MTLNEKYEYSSTATPFVIGEETIDNNPSHEEPIDITATVAKQDKHLVQPAGVGAAVLGFVFGGPIVSALLGFSAAYLVRKKDGIGNEARALGELTISVQEKLAEFEKKSRLVENTTNTINNICDDEKEESIPFKTRAFLVSTWLTVTNFTKENQLLERGVEQTGRGLEFLGKSIEKVKGKSSKPASEVRDTTGSDIQYELMKVEVH